MWYIEADRAEMIKVAIIGIVVGVLTPLLALAITKLILIPVFCSGSSAVCASSEHIGYYAAATLVSAASIAILAAQNIYRPLLISLGALVALWGFGVYVIDLARGSWVEYYAFSALLFALAYVVCYWLMRLRTFGFSVVGLLAIVVVVRLALVS